MVEVHITLFCFFRTYSNGLSRGAAESANFFSSILHFVILSLTSASFSSPLATNTTFIWPQTVLLLFFYCFNFDIFAGIDESDNVFFYYYDFRNDKFLPLSLQAILLQQHLQYESLK